MLSILILFRKQHICWLKPLLLTIQEREALTTRYRLEHERVRELEQLLACVRAQEHQLELESKVGIYPLVTFFRKSEELWAQNSLEIKNAWFETCINMFLIRFSVQDSGTKNAMMRDRLVSLEEQVHLDLKCNGFLHTKWITSLFPVKFFLIAGLGTPH